MYTTFRQEGSNYVLLVDRELEHPPEKVWRALTELDQLAQWFPARVDGEWVVGAALRFTFEPGHADDLPEEELRGEVIAVEEPWLLEFRWGSSRMKYELAPEGDGTRFRLFEYLTDPSWGARSAAGWG